MGDPTVHRAHAAVHLPRGSCRFPSADRNLRLERISLSRREGEPDLTTASKPGLTSHRCARSQQGCLRDVWARGFLWPSPEGKDSGFWLRSQNLYEEEFSANTAASSVTRRPVGQCDLSTPGVLTEMRKDGLTVVALLPRQAEGPDSGASLKWKFNSSGEATSSLSNPVFPTVFQRKEKCKVGASGREKPTTFT